MGWGCYRHEMDAGSVTWGKALDAHLERSRAAGTYWRHVAICPLCADEMQDALLDCFVLIPPERVRLILPRSMEAIRAAQAGREAAHEGSGPQEGGERE